MHRFHRYSRPVFLLLVTIAATATLTGCPLPIDPWGG